MTTAIPAEGPRLVALESTTIGAGTSPEDLLEEWRDGESERACGGIGAELLTIRGVHGCLTGPSTYAWLDEWTSYRLVVTIDASPEEVVGWLDHWFEPA